MKLNSQSIKYWMIKLKNNFNYTKGFKTKKTWQLKEWGLKLKYQVNFIFYWILKLKRKINLTKRQKKRMRIKTEIRNTNKIFFYGWNWKEN